MSAQAYRLPQFLKVCNNNNMPRYERDITLAEYSPVLALLQPVYISCEMSRAADVYLFSVATRAASSSMSRGLRPIYPALHAAVFPTTNITLKSERRPPSHATYFFHYSHLTWLPLSLSLIPL